MGPWEVILLLLCMSSTCLGQAVEGSGSRDRTRLISGRGSINLGQRWGSKSPLMNTSANLTEITSIKSSFEFRTLDPEGVVFYGDTKGGADWFVLGLRGGVPEMQVGKANTLTSVAGGPKLNDGKWHKVELRSEGVFVVLEVDGTAALVLGLHTNPEDYNLEGKMRLSLGGILVRELELLNPLRTEMDGCVRAGNWLNLSTPWEIDVNEELRPCFDEIQKGSYFPGTGLALFNSSDFPAKQMDEGGAEVKIQGHSSEWNGTVLSLTGSQDKPVLTITAKAQTAELIVTFGTQTATLKLGPHSLALKLSGHAVQVELGQQQLSKLVDVTHDWVTMWNKGMVLAFGGVPGDSDSQWLEGCLSLIQVQGQDVDLDWALQKHSFISSHSCPFSP
ncbi:sex hormone-binding globulin [Anguilla rostrata]|uniref:sex hormone-binding globulin n=1 Tax=Anguilla rostrata TaxID=7938 RepID=UPI0030CB25BE